MALRLGYLNERLGHWTIREIGREGRARREGRHLGTGCRPTCSTLRPQKGVDMRIGLDIASMAFKRQVDQIVLIAGDSDFVPAAKLARREGIELHP